MMTILKLVGVVLFVIAMAFLTMWAMPPSRFSKKGQCKVCAVEAVAMMNCTQTCVMVGNVWQCQWVCL